METKVNVVLLGVLLVSWGAMSLQEPVSALDPADHATDELADLEDRFAADPTDARAARDQPPGDGLADAAVAPRQECHLAGQIEHAFKDWLEVLGHGRVSPGADRR